MAKQWRPDKKIDSIVGSLRRFGFKKKDVTKTVLLSVEEVEELIRKNKGDTTKIANLLAPSDTGKDSFDFLE